MNCGDKTLPDKVNREDTDVNRCLACFRHWKQICEDLKSTFDHTSPDFTLEKIIALGLDEHADKISEISGAASKELLIEEVSSLLLVFFF